MFPASSATTPKKPWLVSRIVARPVATSGEGKGRENPCRSATSVKPAYIMRPHSAASVARAGRMVVSIGCSGSGEPPLIFQITAYEELACRRPIKMSPLRQLEMTLPEGFPGGIRGDGLADERSGAFAA